MSGERDFAAERRDLAFLEMILKGAPEGQRVFHFTRRRLILAALIHCNGHKGDAADLLRVHCETVRHHIKGSIAARETVMSPSFSVQREELAFLAEALADVRPGENAFDSLRRRMVTAAILYEEGSQTRAAKLLRETHWNIHRTTKDLGLSPRARRTA